MSDPEADSAFDPGEATGTGVTDGTPADSTPDPDESGQEQGDQSSEKRRIDGLMSLAQKRTSERDQALAEVEALRAQLDAETLADQQGFDGESQIELMHPGQYADSEPDVDLYEPPEPPVIRMDVNPMRPDHVLQSAAPPESSRSARYVHDRNEIAAMKSQLNQLGAEWFEGLKEQGLIND